MNYAYKTYSYDKNTYTTIHHIHHGTLETMAGEIAHIIYAARLLTTLSHSVSHHSYWIGAVFPDIYRVKTSHRYPTHPKPVSLSTIVGQNDFRTGMRVHSWIDATRDHYMREHRAYERLSWHPLLPYALELLEDEILYGAFDDWGIVRRALSTIHPDEIHIVHERLHVKAWHTMLEQYFRQAPSDASRTAFTTSLGISSEIIHATNELIHTLRSDHTAKDILNGYIGELEHMLI